VQKLDIERRKRQCVDLPNGKPANLGALLRHGLPLESANLVKQDDNSGIVFAGRALREGKRRETLGLDHYSKFLVEFANERITGCFAWLDLAPGKFPQPSVVLPGRPFLHQQPAIGARQRAGDHWQPCRNICQTKRSRKLFLNPAGAEANRQAVFDGQEPMPMRKLLKAIASDISGATAVEYGLILAMVFLAMLAAVQSFGNTSIAMWNNIATKVKTA
jgi:pilus assembly protein Flp/PilA